MPLEVALKPRSNRGVGAGVYQRRKEAVRYEHRIARGASPYQPDGRLGAGQETPDRTSDSACGARRLLAWCERCVGAHLIFPGDTRGGYSPLERGGGAGRTVSPLATALFHRL